jgi:hypothetical protein
MLHFDDFIFGLVVLHEFTLDDSVYHPLYIDEFVDGNFSGNVRDFGYIHVWWSCRISTLIRSLFYFPTGTANYAL